MSKKRNATEMTNQSDEERKRQKIEQDIDEFFHAVMLNDYHAVRNFIAQGIDVNTTSTFSMTALHMACEDGNYEVFKELIKAKANVHQEADDGDTPLYYACSSEYASIDIVRDLLAVGASFKKVNRMGVSPIKIACERGHLDIVAEMIRDWNVSSDDDCIEYAAGGTIAIVKMFIAKGLDVYKPHTFGINVLFMSFHLANYILSRFLLANSSDTNLQRLCIEKKNGNKRVLCTYHADERKHESRSVEGIRLIEKELNKRKRRNMFILFLGQNDSNSVLSEVPRDILFEIYKHL